MYSKQEAAQRKKEFWTAFGQYMAPVLSAEGEKQAWVNYKTGEKNILFRMQADNKKGSIAIELTHTDAGMQQLYFEQFLQLKPLFTATVGEEWIWRLQGFDEAGKTVSRIYSEIDNVSILKKRGLAEADFFFQAAHRGAGRILDGREVRF